MEDEEGSEKDQRPDDMGLDDMIPEEDTRYESEDEHVEARHRDRDRPVGPPMEVEVPFRPPPGDPEKVYICFMLLNISSSDLPNYLFFFFCR